MTALNTNLPGAPATDGAMSAELAKIANNPHAMAELSRLLQSHAAAPVGMAPPIGAPSQGMPMTGFGAAPQQQAGAWGGGGGVFQQQQPQQQASPFGAVPQAGGMPAAQQVSIPLKIDLGNGFEISVDLSFGPEVANNPQAITALVMALGNAGFPLKAYPQRQNGGGAFGGGGQGGGYQNGGGYRGGGGGGGRYGGGGGRWWGGGR